MRISIRPLNVGDYIYCYIKGKPHFMYLRFRDISENGYITLSPFRYKPTSKKDVYKKSDVFIVSWYTPLF